MQFDNTLAALLAAWSGQRALSPQLSSRGLTQPFPRCLAPEGALPEGSPLLSTVGSKPPGEFHRPEVVPTSAHGKSCPALPAWPGILRDHEPDALAGPGEALGPRVIMRVRVPGALTALNQPPPAMFLSLPPQ